MKICGNDNKCGKAIDLKKVTRLEVISNDGRILVNDWCSIKLSLQDDNRTLKVFLKDN